MRKPLDQAHIQRLFRELSASAPRKGHYRVYLTGGATAIVQGWRKSTLDADLSANDEAVFRHIQQLKERLELNIEFAKPTDFVPSLEGEDGRHVFNQDDRQCRFLSF